MKEEDIDEDVDYRRAGLGKPSNLGGHIKGGAGKANELTPVGERALDKLAATWELLKARQQKNKAEELRLRAEVIEGIRNCYGADVSRAKIAEKLQIGTTRVSQLANGNYIPGPHARKLPVAPAWSADVQARVVRYLVQALPDDVLEGVVAKRGIEAPVLKPVQACHYCTGAAEYVVEYNHFGEMKERYVCQAHKPMVGSKIPLD